MAVNFPDSPTNGQTVTFGSTTYTYNSTKGIWSSSGTSASVDNYLEVANSTVFVTKADAVASNNAIKVLIDDRLQVANLQPQLDKYLQVANSSSVGSGNTNLTQSDSAPQSPSVSDLWFDTTGLKLYIYYSDGSSNQWVQTNPSGTAGNAITELDQWRITADITADTDPISANLERVDDASFAKLGTGMSVSSGIWTFPSTGLWEVGNNLTALVTTTDTVLIIRTYVSTDGGSSWDEVATTRAGYGGSGNAWYNGSSFSFINVTSTANVKVKFIAASITSGNMIKGNTDTNLTHFTFKRLGNSQ